MAAVLRYSLRRFLAKSQVSQLGSTAKASTIPPPHHEGGYKMWKNVSLFVAFPAIILCAVNCYLAEQHHHERPPFVKYDYLRVRTKRFPWGDGNHSLFHNKHFNALPDGYED